MRLVPILLFSPETANDKKVVDLADVKPERDPSWQTSQQKKKKGKKACKLHSLKQARWINSEFEREDLQDLDSGNSKQNVQLC